MAERQGRRAKSNNDSPRRKKEKKACLRQGFKRRLRDVLRGRAILPRDEGAQGPEHELPLACRQYQRSSWTCRQSQRKRHQLPVIRVPLIAVSIITRCWTRMPRPGVAGF